jgi:hypothetical protein
LEINRNLVGRHSGEKLHNSGAGQAGIHFDLAFATALKEETGFRLSPE